jgi:hypothetical protein
MRFFSFRNRFLTLPTDRRSPLVFSAKHTLWQVPCHGQFCMEGDESFFQPPTIGSKGIAENLLTE